tara:strand:- start:255 stop:605 length:351 start_codon:yes stop_codon:yes gene_type:complete
MVKTRQSMLPGAKNTSKKIKEKELIRLMEDNDVFNKYWSGLSDKQVNTFKEIGYNKSTLKNSFLKDTGALGFKAMMNNVDNFNTIGVKKMTNSYKKFANGLLSAIKDPSNLLISIK